MVDIDDVDGRLDVVHSSKIIGLGGKQTIRRVVIETVTMSLAQPRG